MDEKYSKEIEEEINDFLNKINLWQKHFKITTNYFYDGWAIYLRELAIYPRFIIIFKPYTENYYSISSFEIHFTKNNKEVYKMLYINDKIITISDLVSEFKRILYGKDIFASISNSRTIMHK